MEYWITTEGTGHYFFYAFPVCLLILFIIFTGRRVRFIIPSLLMTLLIVNPLFYKYWEELGLYAYWRILWLVPVIPVVAGTVPAIIEKARNCFLKGLIAAVAVIAVAFGGTFVYSTVSGKFTVPATNIDKLSVSAVKVADRLLELKEQPRVILQDPLGVYIRQYTGDVNTLFGRDISGFIYDSSKTAKKINSIIGSQTADFSEVSQFMLDDEYDYLVMTVRKTNETLELVDTVAGYGIYKASGKPGVKKERNELGQVLRETIIDDNGKPTNGKAGYSTIQYEYDKDGYIVREFHTDTEGKGVADSKGQAGYERRYDKQGNVQMERILGADGKPLLNSVGYAEIRRIYKQKKVVWEGYYDELSQPVNRINKQYAAVSFEWDDKKHITHEQYWNTAGKATAVAGGYAEVRREYDELYKGEYLTRESYYDTNGEPVCTNRGYAAVCRMYDQNGNITVEQYEDEQGRPVNCIDGYAYVKQEYGENNEIIYQAFYNSLNRPVESYTGYAGINREYRDQGKFIREEYYDANGWPKILPAGHEISERAYDEAGRPLFRRYLNYKNETITRTDGYSEVRWLMNDNTNAYDVQFYASDGTIIPMDGVNLATDIPGDNENWSAWMIPSYNVNNATINVGTLNLGDKHPGDTYTCQFEIEFRNVQSTEGMPFRFVAQGAADGKWNNGNIWNSKLIKLDVPPQDGIYTYTATNTVDEKMTGVTTFNIGFRCDYWNGGLFRIRKIKVESGESATEWTPGI